MLSYFYFYQPLFSKMITVDKFWFVKLSLRERLESKDLAAQHFFLISHTLCANWLSM